MRWIEANGVHTMLKNKSCGVAAKQWYILCLATVLLLLICGCSTTTAAAESSTNTEKSHPIDDEAEAAVPLLDSINYWENVHDEIVSMLHCHGVYISAINSSYPCVLYYVEPGIETDSGKIMAVGLTQAEYEELYQCIKEELHIILDKYKLAKPKTVFHACDSDVGVFFYNWFLDKNKVYDRVISREVGSYQIDLLKYYHEDRDGDYTCWGGFSAQKWSEYEVYIP